MTIRGLPEDRFWDKVSPEPNTGCWLWTGTLAKGYGRFWSGPNGGLMAAHRFAYGYYRRGFSTGLTLDHLCREPSCVNPGHLEEVTMAENIRRVPPGRRGGPPPKTHCPKGHPYDSANTVIHSGFRRCRICRRARWSR